MLFSTDLAQDTSWLMFSLTAMCFYLFFPSFLCSESHNCTFLFILQYLTISDSQSLLLDYKGVTVFVTDTSVKQCCGSGAFLTPRSGMGKKSRSGSGMTALIIFPRSWRQFFGLKILKFFDTERMRIPGFFFTLDPGWKNLDPRSGINIPDP